ncbi:MAG: transcriptional regulator NrdR [Parcubacteria group bacterium CG1_02_37_51]|uniref:Transcriptional repressor NrdR n=2 Tax=Candidatus Komeiliibacteriota TaxID=1817908 RepID=A0A2M8DPZ6_9BACT|nr:MAG: transcriptional regulator NrdR [Parcubacteria group bacterium CG1_02_37_51]PIY94240.1 MAG: transcriptional regulator NrdR [Candidatus Komeilibacteria bacterium CG_4_10_14_0_8_um_filter_37_78]PJC00997.1 MAG: transcriptional regulator NrdR [Candidatus Komeilibacteria bacterium CG_4_9_14_0_8_um_filter_36_9]
MQCPLCLKKDTKVLDSRLIADGFAVRRRRECQDCSFRFSTYEEMEILNISVVKRDGRSENYSREKMARGIEKALEKRSYTSDDFKKLLNRIERDIQKLRRDEITSNKLGEIVIKQLKKFDKVAYIRFASVYYSFEDVKSFTREIKNLKIKK